MGSITGNRNTLAGNIPPQADLGGLEGLKAGFKYPNVMINGGDWEAPKAYKDAKVPPPTPQTTFCAYFTASLFSHSSLSLFCVAVLCVCTTTVPWFLNIATTRMS